MKAGKGVYPAHSGGSDDMRCKGKANICESWHVGMQGGH